MADTRERRGPRRGSAGHAKLGRPAGKSSEETRQQIIYGARDCFAQAGYGPTTIADIARESGVSMGAIYHYVEGKDALFGAVTDAMFVRLAEEFGSAAQGQTSFVEAIGAVLDAATRIHETDPMLARFAIVAPIELRRHPELAEMTTAPVLTIPWALVEGVYEATAPDGEGAPADQVDMLVAMLYGLSYLGAMVDDPRRHAEAVVATKELLRRGLDQTTPRTADSERVRRLEAENARLKVLLAEAELEKAALRAANR